jgi:hypothetical protein
MVLGEVLLEEVVVAEEAVEIRTTLAMLATMVQQLMEASQEVLVS